MTTDERIAAFLAERKSLADPSLISDIRMEASEGRAWSEITVDSFGCSVRFKYGTEEMVDWWDEEDAVAFLNRVWAASNQDDAPAKERQS